MLGSEEEDKGRKSISHRNQKPTARLRESGHNEHQREGHLLGGTALLTERSKAGLLMLSFLSRGSDHIHDLS